LHLLLDALPEAVHPPFMTGERAARTVLVAALGNPDRGDDGAGPEVARLLEGRLPPNARIVARRGDMLSLIDEWAGCDALICIDAAASPEAEPGRIRRFDLAREELPQDLSFTSSHAFGLPEAIALARTLDLAPPRILVYAIVGRCFDAGAALSPEVLAAAAQVADRVAAEMSRLSMNEEPRTELHLMSGETAERRTLRVRITGRVQGVSYRWWTERNAVALGLQGWVRNRRDGAVEAMFSGASEAVFEMVRRCWEGPPAALVEEVAIVEEGGSAPLGFAVLPTA
jgi:hydrogenase maturation protease